VGVLALAWLTPLLTEPFTSFSFTTMDFYVIAVIGILALAVLCTLHAIRKRKTALASWSTVGLTVLQAYLFAIVAFAILRLALRT
jgi:hypothetical protein